MRVEHGGRQHLSHGEHHPAASGRGSKSDHRNGDRSVPMVLKHVADDQGQCRSRIMPCIASTKEIDWTTIKEGQ